MQKVFPRLMASLVTLFLIVSCGGSGGSGGYTGPVITGTGPAACVDGMADQFACSGVSLAKRLPLAELEANSGNDLWGWTDPVDGAEYVLMGVDNGTVFVRITDPQNPVIVGKLATQTVSSGWRDIKVYQNVAYIVADDAGAHGMQVFDLTRLRTGGNDQTFLPDVVYGDFGNAHNVAINESSGFAYAVGSNTCGGGLHMVDIRTPLSPMFAGCAPAADPDHHTHDTQCVNYAGPDADYAGAEICFSSNAHTVDIVDVSDKSSPVTLSSLGYPMLGFVHQAWLDESQQYLFVGDEFDEQDFGVPTSTIVLDVSDLDAPAYLYTHEGNTFATDHNQYVVGNHLYQANYTAGLSILEFGDLTTNTLEEVGYFDTFPDSEGTGFSGAWSVYPFFASGTLAVSDDARGLFLLTVD